MFESMSSTGLGLDPATASEETGGTRAFAWSELVARLAATRDARAVLATVGPVTQAPGRGSFVTGSLTREAVRAQDEPNNESAVNPIGLWEGKAGGTLSSRAASPAVTVDREAQ